MSTCRQFYFFGIVFSFAMVTDQSELPRVSPYTHDCRETYASEDFRLGNGILDFDHVISDF